MINFITGTSEFCDLLLKSVRELAGPSHPSSLPQYNFSPCQKEVDCIS